MEENNTRKRQAAVPSQVNGTVDVTVIIECSSQRPESGISKSVILINP